MTAEHLNPAWRTVNPPAEHLNLAWRTVNLPAEHLNLVWRTVNLFADHLKVLIGHFLTAGAEIAGSEGAREQLPGNCVRVNRLESFAHSRIKWLLRRRSGKSA
jgi:hypothetical protein